MFISQLRFDLKKNICSVHFLLAVLVTLVLAMSGNFTVDAGADRPAYNFIQLLFNTDKSLWQTSHYYCDAYMFLRGFRNEWQAIFLPAVMGLACVPQMCDEINSGNCRFIISRCGRRVYVLSKFLSAIITTMLVIFTAYLIFAVICLAIFPPAQFYLDRLGDDRHSEYIRSELEFSQFPLNAFFKSGSFVLLFVSRAFTASLFSVIPCLLSMALGALTLNKFVSLSLPVMFYFGLSHIAEDLVNKALGTGADMPLMLFWEAPYRFGDVEVWFERDLKMPLYVMYLYLLAVTVLLYFAFSKAVRKRVLC